MAYDTIRYGYACGCSFGGNLFDSGNVSDRQSDIRNDGGGKSGLCDPTVENLFPVSGHYFPYDASGIGNDGITDPED